MLLARAAVRLHGGRAAHGGAGGAVIAKPVLINTRSKKLLLLHFILITSSYGSACAKNGKGAKTRLNYISIVYS